MPREKKTSSNRIERLIPDRQYDEIMQIKSAGEKLEKNEIRKWWRVADERRKDSEGKFIARAADKFDGANIKGWAVGEQIKNGAYTGRLCITVYTQFKTIPESIEEDTILPPIYGGYAINVVECGPLTSRPINAIRAGNPLFDPKRKFRPAPAGISVGHPKVTVGTLGCYCATRGDDLLILSNNHVIAASNNASKGDKILQPGASDNGNGVRDSFGKLHSWINLKSNGPDNLVDAALATVNNSADVNTDILNIGSVREVTCMADIGTQVQKMGRTTGYTTGRVEGLGGTFKVDYRESDRDPPHEVVFKDITTVTPGTFSGGGDSGSLILDRANRAVALLFGGGTAHTLAIPICTVMDALKIVDIL